LGSIKWVAFVVGALAMSLADTSAGQEKNPCHNPQTQVQINECAAKEYKTSDGELNLIYKQLYSRLSSRRRTQLRAAQAAWIKYRDAQCEFENAEERGGSIYSALQYGCLSTISRARTAELKRFLENTPGK
jgi:uncharacterized protein YecT (DUF1311 family)